MKILRTPHSLPVNDSDGMLTWHGIMVAFWDLQVGTNSCSLQVFSVNQNLWDYFSARAGTAVLTWYTQRSRMHRMVQLFPSTVSIAFGFFYRRMELAGEWEGFVSLVSKIGENHRVRNQQAWWRRPRVLWLQLEWSIVLTLVQNGMFFVCLPLRSTHKELMDVCQDTLTPNIIGGNREFLGKFAEFLTL